MTEEAKKEQPKMADHGFEHAIAMPAPEFVKQEGGTTVTMVFPRRVLLQLDDHRHVEFSPGPQQVPRELAGHWYLKANGVTLYEPKVIETPVTQSESAGGESEEQEELSEAEPDEQEVDREPAEAEEDSAAKDSAAPRGRRRSKTR